jgi:hypothetical protein
MSLIRQVWQRYELGKVAVLLVVAGNLVISIVANGFAAFDPAHPSDYYNQTDSKVYLSLYFGEPITGTARYRAVVPFLARLIPDTPLRLALAPNRPLDRVSLPALKFAIVNLFFLVATCVLLLYIIQGFGLSYTQGLLGSLLFLSLFVVGQYGGHPMTEPGYFFCLALGVLAVQRQNLWVLAIATIVGVFVKEQVFLVTVLILLAPFERSSRLRLLGAVLPAVIVYGVVRFGLAPVPNDKLATGQFLLAIPKAIRAQFFTLMGIRNIFLMFGLLWIPCLYAIVRCRLPVLLARWIWFVPILLILMIALGGGAGAGAYRHGAAAFPIVIPLALIGLNGWLEPRKTLAEEK